MKKKINDTHLAFIAMGVIVILSIIAIINITLVVKNYGSKIVEGTSNILNTAEETINSELDKASNIGQNTKRAYLTQVNILEIVDSNSSNEYVTYKAYCEQFDEEIEIRLEAKYKSQITIGWNYRATKTVDTDENTMEYKFIFDNEAKGVDVSIINYDVVDMLEGMVVDKKESLSTSGKTVYLVKISVEDEGKTLYVTTYATEEQFNYYESGDNLEVMKKEAKVGLSTVIVTYEI